MTEQDRASKSAIIIETNNKELNIFKLEEQRKLAALKEQAKFDAEQFDEDQKILYKPELFLDDVFFHMRREAAFRRERERRRAEVIDNPQKGLHGSGVDAGLTDVQIAKSIVGGKRKENVAHGPFV
jgi:hypothetical protein